MLTLTERQVTCAHCGATWRDSHPDAGYPVWCGDCERIAVGMDVKYHTYEHGWRYGRIIGTHYDGRVAMATVRFLARKGRWDEHDEAVPCFRMEKCQ